MASGGDIELGQVLYGKKKMYPFFLKENTLLMHMGIFGSTGYGKTNISYYLLDKLSELGIPVIVFDFSKRNYRDLLSTHMKDRIDVYTVGRDAVPFKYNPLKPPEGIQLSQWIKEFASIFDHAYSLLGGGRHLILKTLSAIHDEKKKPRMADMKVWLEKYNTTTSLSTRERNWLSTALRPMESLCFNEISRVWDCDEGIVPSEFFKKGRITVLELDALDANDRSFFIEIVLQWLRDWLLVSGSREKLRGMIILEESHHVLSREKGRQSGTETVVDLIFREVRELGLGIIYIDQHPSMISYPALGNTSTHIYMNLGLDTRYSSDVMDASNMLGLDYKEDGNYLRRLPIGHGFVLCRWSDFTNPFLMEFYKFQLKKGSVSDADVRSHMAGKIKFSAEAEAQPQEEKYKFAPTTETAGEKTEIPAEELDEKETEIIKVLGSGTSIFTSEIYKQLKMSGTAFAEKIKKLVGYGFVLPKEGKIGKNKMNYYYLTNRGEKIYTEEFGALSGEVKMEIKELMDIFASAGWVYEKAKNLVYFDKGGKRHVIFLWSKMDRENIRSNIFNKARHFIAANERIKNLIIQEACRFSFENGEPLVLFVSTAKEFSERGKFERLEIQ